MLKSEPPVRLDGGGYRSRPRSQTMSSAARPTTSGSFRSPGSCLYARREAACRPAFEDLGEALWLHARCLLLNHPQSLLPVMGAG